MDGYRSLDVFDTYTYLGLGFFAMIACLILISAHAFSNELRKQPGDLILMIAFAEFWLCLHWFMSAIRTDYVTTSYPEDSFFCKANSVIAVNAATLEITYNLCFIAHIFFSIRNSIRKSYMPKVAYHVFCWSVTVTTFIAQQPKMYKKNPYGTCSIDMSPKDVVSGAIIIVISIIFATYVYIKTKTQMPMIGMDMIKLRRQITDYFSRYLKSLIIIWTIIFFSFIAQLLSNSRGIGKVFFEIGRFGNTVKVLMPLVFFLLRTEDPQVKKMIDKYLYGILDNLKIGLQKVALMHKEEKKNQGEQDEHDIIITGNSSFVYENQEDLETEMISEETDDQSWMSLLPAKLKEMFTRTFLACISVYYPSLLETTQSTRMGLFEENDNHGVVKYSISGKQLMGFLHNENAILDCDLNIYAPSIFSNIIMNNQRQIDFRSSFDLFLNEDKIKKAGESGGGASGELFMFSFDGKLIIKTITQDEYLVFQNILFDYGSHFKNNPNSLIAKIYGLFDFNFAGTEKSLKLIVMENLFTIGNDSILRKYDMKGSTHSRRVLRSYQEYSIDSSISAILKDLDFLQIDKKLEFEETGENEKMNFLARVESDVSFFKNHSIIDYSLVVAVIDIQLCDESTLLREMRENRHHIFKSKDGRFLFAIGIIDYFQLYDLKKRFERSFKQLQKCNPGLETSSQPPKRYANRFSTFVESIMK